MTNWYSTIYKSCIYASIISFIIGFFSNSATSLDAYLAGYSVLILGVMMILIILFSNVLKMNVNSSTSVILYSIFMTSGPFILMLGILSFVLYLLVNWRENIIQSNVAPGFTSFNTIILILIMMQLYLVISNINTEKFEMTGRLTKVTSSILYLLGILTGVSSITLYTILKYYSTDG
jgi:hypothetical protein